MTAPCIFCAIVRGEAEASFVHEDDVVVAFMDIQPVTQGHVLVVPRDHLPSLSDIPPDVGAHMFRVGQAIAAALRRSDQPCDGVNLFYADGEAAFQEVFHGHLHVFPRTPGDGFGIVADWRMRSRDELDATAGCVRAGLAGA
jgi:diadenosine tetraphosphate (Ap4A) HIT family hydrolase